jgi:hypothetical protein
MRRSDTYLKLIDLLFELGRSSNNGTSYAHTFANGKYERLSTSTTSTKFYQPLLLSDLELCDICTDAEWRFIRYIIKDLKEYNALWYCDPELKNNSTNKNAIKGLVDKSIMFKTETTNIYLINPRYMRRGDLWAVIVTTADTLRHTPRVGIEHIANRKPVKLFQAGDNTNTTPLLLNN